MSGLPPVEGASRAGGTGRRAGKRVGSAEIGGGTSAATGKTANVSGELQERLSAKRKVEEELRQVREEHRSKMEELRVLEDQLFAKEQRLKAKRAELSKMERMEGSKKARAMERFLEEEQQRREKGQAVEKLKEKLHKMYRQKKEKEEMLEEFGEFTTYLYMISSGSGTSNLNEPQDILHRFHRLRGTHEELTREIDSLSQQLEERRREGKHSVEEKERRLIMLNRNLISRHTELSKMQSEMHDLEQHKQHRDKSANSVTSMLGQVRNAVENLLELFDPKDVRRSDLFGCLDFIKHRLQDYTQIAEEEGGLEGGVGAILQKKQQHVSSTGGGNSPSGTGGSSSSAPPSHRSTGGGGGGGGGGVGVGGGGSSGRGAPSAPAPSLSSRSMHASLAEIRSSSSFASSSQGLGL